MLKDMYTKTARYMVQVQYKGKKPFLIIGLEIDNELSDTAAYQEAEKQAKQAVDKFYKEHYPDDFNHRPEIIEITRLGPIFIGSDYTWRK